MSAALVAADFHYVHETCSEAQGGYYDSGIFVTDADGEYHLALTLVPPLSPIPAQKRGIEFFYAPDA